MQGLAQRAKRDRQALPRRLDAPSATGPQFRDVPDDGSAESSYYTWVDWFDTFGLGRNVPIATGNMNDSLLALADGKFVNLRALSDRLLHQMGGRAYRRCECRLEGQVTVDDLLHQNNVPSRRRQGEPAAIPVAARSAGR